MLLILLTVVLVVGLVAIAMHAGPHGSLISGVAGLLIGVALAWSMAGAIASGLAWTLGALVAVVGLVVGFVGLRGLRGLNARAALATPSQLALLLGAEGTVELDLAPVGAVRVRGESWTAVSETGEHVPAGTTVFVTRVDGLRLWVLAAPADERGSDQLRQRGLP